MPRRDEVSVAVDVDVEDDDQRHAKGFSNNRRRTKEPSRDRRRGRTRESSSERSREYRSRDDSDDEDLSKESEAESEPRSRGEKKGDSAAPISRLIRAVICLLLLIAALFMFFTALSTPVIKAFYFFSLEDEEGTSGKYEFGIWGYCFPAVMNSFGAQTYDSGCSGTRLGWTLAEVPGFADEDESIKHALTGAFLMNVLVILILLLAFLASLVAVAVPDLFVRKSGSHSNTSRDSDGPGAVSSSSSSSNSNSRSNARDKDNKEDAPASENGRESAIDTGAAPSRDQVSSGRRRMSALVAVATVFSLFFMVVVFFFDLGALLQIRHNVDNASDLAFSFGWGPAFWFVLAAFVLVLLAFILSIVGLVLTVAKNPKSTDKKSSDDSADRNSESESEEEKDTRRTTPPVTPARSTSEYSEGVMVDVDLRSDAGGSRTARSSKNKRKKR